MTSIDKLNVKYNRDTSTLGNKERTIEPAELFKIIGRIFTIV